MDEDSEKQDESQEDTPVDILDQIDEAEAELESTDTYLERRMKEILASGQGSKKESKAEADADATTAAEGDGEPEKSPGSDTASADATDDGEDAAGKESVEDKADEADDVDKTSRAVQRRLKRERVKHERALAEKEAEIAALKKFVEGKAAETKPESKEDKPAETRKRPVLTDFANVDEWLAEYEKYEAGEDLASQDVKESGDTKPAEPAEPTAIDKMRGLFQDVQENLDESDLEDEKIEEFNEAFKQDKILLTEPVLEWMADNDESVELVKAFLEKPRASRRIARMSTPKAQLDAVKRLLRPSKKEAAAPKPQASKAPDIKAISAGRRSADVDPANLQEYDDYETWRAKQKSRSLRGLI